MHDLEVLILMAKKQYYKKGTSWLTDAEYDNLEDSLKVINPNSCALCLVGYDSQYDDVLKRYKRIGKYNVKLKD